jgi:hypothetical protein
MKTDKHEHETIQYLGIGTVQYPEVREGETPFAVAVRETERTVREEKLIGTAKEIMRDHVQGTGMLFRQQHPEIQARFAHIAKVYGLTP